MQVLSDSVHKEFHTNIICITETFTLASWSYIVDDTVFIFSAEEISDFTR